MLRLLAAAFALLAWLGPAGAHSGKAPAGPDSGIGIPALTHGQMAGMAPSNRAILDLAARQPAPDSEFQRVLNFARIQQAWCAWGLMPGGVSDESSPFNPCSHAYLAASRDLLLRMAATPDPRAAALLRRVELDMIANSSATELCAFSGDGFNTAQVVKADWSAALTHPKSLATLLALVSAGAGAVWFGRRLLARR